jgi:hypothetical protein
MKIRVCKVNYRSFRGLKLSGFAEGVKNGLYANPSVFGTPPIAADEYAAVEKNYNLSWTDYKTYGITKKTAYGEATNKLIGVFDRLALYVNSVANGDASRITLAGFEPTTQGSQAAPILEKIETVTVTPSVVSGQVFIETPAIVGQGVSGYGLILKSGAPFTSQDFVDGQLNITVEAGENIRLDFNKSRKKVINGLDSNITYIGYMYAVNASSVSPLSEPRTVKSI